MSEIETIWNELHNTALLLNSPNSDGLKTAESVFNKLNEVLNDIQLLQIIAIPDDPVVCKEAVKGLARRYNRLNSVGDNPNIWKDLLKLCMNSEERLVYRTGFAQIASILSCHYNHSLFIDSEPTEIRQDFIIEIESYMNEAYLVKLIMFLSDLTNEMAREWDTHCNFGIVAKTQIRTWSRDLYVPKVFMWLKEIANLISSIQGEFLESQYDLYCGFLSLFQSLIRFNSPHNSSIEELDTYYLPRIFETDVQLLLDIPMIILRRALNVSDLIDKVLEVLGDLAGHKIYQPVSHPISEGNKIITAGLANNLLEVTQTLSDVYTLQMLTVIKNFIINLPFEYPAHELCEMVYNVSINVFNNYVECLDDLTVESMNNLRDIWRRLRDRSEGKIGGELFTQLLAKLIPIVERIKLNEEQMIKFFKSDSVKSIGSTAALLSRGNFPSVLQMFAEKIVSYISNGMFTNYPINTVWNLFLFSECIQSFVNCGGSDLALTYYKSDPPVVNFQLGQLLEYPFENLDVDLLKLIATPFHCLSFVYDNRMNLQCHVAACSIALSTSATLLVCKLEDDNGIFRAENVVNDVFKYVFTKVYEISSNYRMEGPIGYQLSSFSKNMSLNDLFLGHKQELITILDVCLNGGFAPPKFTGTLFEGLLRQPQEGNELNDKILHFFTNFSRHANKTVDDPVYLNYAILQTTGIFKEAGYLEFFESVAATVMDFLSDAIKFHGKDDLILQNCLNLFREIIPSYLNYLSHNHPADSSTCFKNIMLVIESVVSVGTGFWIKADTGNYSYDSLILLLECCSDILERQGILDLGDQQEKIVYNVVIHILLHIYGSLTNQRMMSPDVAKSVVGLTRNVCETSNAIFSAEIPADILEMVQSILLFGLDLSRDKETCDMVLGSIDHISNKIGIIPPTTRSIWIEFFKKLFHPMFKIALNVSSSSDTFWMLSNFFYNIMMADTEYLTQFFRSLLPDSHYQEEVDRLVLPLIRDTPRAKRCDFRERFTLFKDRVQNWITL